MRLNAADIQELLHIRRSLIDLRMMLALDRLALLLKAYNPDQPRVPAGRPDGGQWTDGEAGETPQRVRLAQLDGPKQYSVDLSEEEARGGHALRDHVGKTDGELLAVVRNDRFPSLFFTVARRREGAFISHESANDFVNRTLEQNISTVDEVARGKRADAFMKSRFGYATGKEAFQPPDLRLEPYIRTTYSVGVYIVRDRGSPRGYTVRTAYPMND